MRNCTITLMLLVLSLSSRAQTAEERAIVEPVNRLFQGMKSGDSTMVHSAFAREVTFVTVGKNKGGQSVIEQDDLKKFLKAVGTPHPEVWSEVIWGTEVRVDGDFAQVWADYGFYIGKKFSHCGVDAFHLFKSRDGWRIFHLADTRRREGCQVPPEVSDQFK